MAPQLVNQRLATGPGEESADHVGVYDVRERVALLGEMTYVVPKGLTGLLLAALEISGIARANVRALEVADEKLAEVRPAAD